MPCWPVYRHPSEDSRDAAATSSGVTHTRHPVPLSVSSRAEEGVVLYHQTSFQNAQGILCSGGRMHRGPPGFGGSGIYFAVDPEATSCKANHKGVILECVVRLGRTRLVHRVGDWGGWWRRTAFRYDSVALTFLEGGIEYVIFDPRRVVSVKVHKVLPSFTSMGSLSTDGTSSFEISTATDPGCCSSDSSSSGSGQSSDAASSSSSDSGESSHGRAQECSSQVATCRSHHTDAALCQPTCSSPCSSSAGLQSSQCILQTSSSSCPAQAGCCSSSSGGGTTNPDRKQADGATCSLSDLQGQAAGVHQAPSGAPHSDRAGPRQRQHQDSSIAGSSSCRCCPQHEPHPGRGHTSCEAALHAASLAEHMVVLLEDHMQKATCSKMAQSHRSGTCRQLVGA